MEKRAAKIEWRDDKATVKIGEFVIELQRGNNELIEVKAKEFFCNVKPCAEYPDRAEYPYSTLIQGNYIKVNMGSCGLKKFELANDTLIEIY